MDLEELKKDYYSKHYRGVGAYLALERLSKRKVRKMEIVC